SKVLGSSKSFLKSATLRACVCLAAAESNALALTSHKATMFSDDTDSRLLAPRPPEPMMAMFNLLLRFWPRSSAGAVVIAPANESTVRVNRRRFKELVFIEYNRITPQNTRYSKQECLPNC